jgi:cell division protein FtsI (penicillin-binding protein 3)
MTSGGESRRGTRSHANSQPTSSSRSASRPRSKGAAPGRPGGVKTDSRSARSSSSSSRTRTPQSERSTSRSRTQRALPVDTPPIVLLGKQLWTWVTKTLFGEVPDEYKSQRISSKQAENVFRSRMRGAFLILILLLSVVCGRVFLLQTFQRDKYLAISIDQRTRVKTIRAERGVIFDRNGNELALSVPSVTVYADPRVITDFAGTARALAPSLGLTAEQEAKLAADLAVPGSQFRYLARELTKEKADAILALGLKGVASYIEPARTVEGGVASAIIGKTDPDGLGVSGLEMQFNDVLAGKDGQTVREVDVNGRTIPGAETTKTKAEPGDDLVLSVDKTIQYNTDAALLDRVGQLNAKGGTAIVMNTQTGEVYAMSNVRRDKNGATVLATGNFAAVEAYEPGSVAKVFSISAALNEGVVTPEETLKVPGIITIDKFPIRDAWPHGVIDMSVRNVMVESSNVGTLLVAQKMQSNSLYNYLTAFGFGLKSGLGYPGESRGILRPASKWRGTEKVTVSYGYGLSATPLQLIAGVNTVANGGTYVAPRLVNATIDKAGKQRPYPASTPRTVLKPEVAAQMTDMMRGVVCAGTGTKAQVKGMEIAGKTGTGYKVQSNGLYTTITGGRKYFASFVGFFPAAAPKVTMLVSIDEPDASTRDRFGGTAAAPVFARLVPNVMHELGIEATGTGTGCKATDKPAAH